MSTATIVNSQEEIDKEYYYVDKSKSPKAERFPCILVQTYHDCGLMGSHYIYELVYCPRLLNLSKDYISGYLTAAQLFISLYKD